MEGDSNTDFIFVGKYGNNFYNVAVGGSTTWSVKNRIEMVRAAQPSVIVLMIGTNNASSINQLLGESKATEQEYYDDIQIILDAYKTITKRIYVVSILPMTPNVLLKGDNNTLVKNMNVNLKSIVESNGCTFIDEWNDFYDVDNNKLFSELDGDSVHLSEAGKDLHMKNVMEAISK
jgi:lysophospholipase L1-like esterase